MAQAGFIHKLFIPGDDSGFGMWRSEHADQHNKFVQLAAGFTAPVRLRTYDIMSWDVTLEFQKAWNLAHYEMHQSLRDATKITGMDFTQVDWSDPQDVSTFLENHKFEHELYEEAFNLT